MVTIAVEDVPGAGVVVMIVVVVVVVLVVVVVCVGMTTGGFIDPGSFWYSSKRPCGFFASFTMFSLISSASSAALLSGVPLSRALNCWMMMLKNTTILPCLQIIYRTSICDNIIFRSVLNITAILYYIWDSYVVL